MKAVSRWWALKGGERLLLPFLMLALPLISLTLRVAGYKRTRSLVEGLSNHRHPREASREEIEGALRLAHLAAIAGRRGPVQATCLRQALAVYGMLRRHGLRPELKFGVRREDDGIGAHAWVELEQRSLDVTGDPDAHQPFTH